MDQVHGDPPPEGGRGVVVTEGSRRLTGVTTTPRKLECFGTRSWKRLKAIMAGLPAAEGLRQPGARRRKLRKPKQAGYAKAHVRRPKKGESAPNAQHGAPQVEVRPQRQRWDLVSDEYKTFGELDRDAEDRLRRWLQGQT